MTKDLALAVKGKQMTKEDYVTTEGFLDHIREQLEKKVKKGNYAKL